MSHTRRIELDCKSGDGTVATASLAGGAEYVILRTSNGRPVHLAFADGRELAAWLIEHCTDGVPVVDEPAF